MKVICINNSNKPNNIPSSEWIELGGIYTVTKVKSMGLQPGKLGFLLKEVQLSELSFPYEMYDAERFLPVQSHPLKQNQESIEEPIEEIIEEELLTI